MAIGRYSRDAWLLTKRTRGGTWIASLFRKIMMQKIKSIELPDVNYKLTKRSALNKKASNFGKGLVFTGPLGSSHISVGNHVSVGYGISSTWFTTRVTKIRVLKNKVVFHTENSIYELEELHEI